MPEPSPLHVVQVNQRGADRSVCFCDERSYLVPAHANRNLSAASCSKMHLGKGGQPTLDRMFTIFQVLVLCLLWVPSVFAQFMLPVPVGEREDLSVEVSTDRDDYLPGTPVVVRAEVCNRTDAQINVQQMCFFEPYLEIQASNGNIVATARATGCSGSVRVREFPPGHCEVTTYVWHQTPGEFDSWTRPNGANVPFGTYTIIHRSFLGPRDPMSSAPFNIVSSLPVPTLSAVTVLLLILLVTVIGCIKLRQQHG